MKLVTFLPSRNGSASGVTARKGRLGAAVGEGKILDFARVDTAFSGVGILEFLRDQHVLLPKALGLMSMVNEISLSALIDERRVTFLSPIPRPVSIRDGYAFRRHVETARKNRGLPMIPEFDLFPVFYFTNHLSVIGPGELRVGRRRLERLDFELECFCVIGKTVTNPTLEEADDAILGYGVLNDFSARALQTEEMKLNLGPAKGKDFATALGPWIVTKDELGDRLEATARGNVLHARMTAHVNGVKVSEGDVAQMDWTFAQIVQRAADGVVLEPGEVIGSGTVGTGCFLELNGSGITKDRWLVPGDEVSLTIDGLGTLTNHVFEDVTR